MSKHNRKKIRAQMARLAALDKAAERKLKKRDEKTERWVGGIKPAAWSAPKPWRCNPFANI